MNAIPPFQPQNLPSPNQTSTAIMDLPTTTTTSRQPARSTFLTKTNYLVTYNTISLLLWGTILLRLVALVPLVGPRPIVEALHPLLRFTQTVAVLEPLHVLTGLVRAPLLTTAMQIASRVLLVWGIVGGLGAQEVGRSLGYPVMLAAWAATEVVRYAYFVDYLRRGAGAGTGGVGDGRLGRWLGWLRYVL